MNVITFITDGSLTPKNENSRDYCKADHKSVYCFLITVFRLAIPAVFRFIEGWYGRNIVLRKQYTLSSSALQWSLDFSLFGS